GGPARRAPGTAAGVPRVPGGAEQLGLRDSLGPELRGVGLAEDHQARVQPPPDHGRVLGRRYVGQWTRPATGGCSAVVLTEILEKERHPGERARQLLGRPGASRPVQAAHDRVESRVDTVGALDRRVEQVARGDLALPDEGGETEGIVTTELVKAHGAGVYAARSATVPVPPGAPCARGPQGPCDEDGLEEQPHEACAVAVEPERVRA